MKNIYKTPSYFYVCFIVAFLELTLNQSALNLFEHYTVPGGNFLEKFHPATYVELLLFFFIASRGDFWLNRRVHADFIFIFIWICLCIYLAAEQKFAYMSVIVDEYLFTAISWMLYRSMDDRSFGRIFGFLMFVLLLNLPIVIGEDLLHQTFLPTPQEAAYFRPCGLFGHPIFTGYMCCIGLLGARYYFPKFGVRRIVMLALIAEVALCGVRGPLITAFILLAIDVVSPKGVKRRDMQTIVLEVGMVVAGIVAVLGLALAGVFQRIAERGLWDASAASRVGIINTLAYLKGDEWLYGISAERALYYSSNVKIEIIESSLVLSIFIGGLFLTVPWALTLVVYFWQRGSKNILFFGLMSAIFMTSLSFSVKGQVPFSLFILMELIRRNAEKTKRLRQTSANAERDRLILPRTHKASGNAAQRMIDD